MTEILNGLKSAELTGVKESYDSVSNVIKVKKEKISEKLKKEISDFLKNKNENDDIQKIIKRVVNNFL